MITLEPSEADIQHAIKQIDEWFATNPNDDNCDFNFFGSVTTIHKSNVEDEVRKHAKNSEIIIKSK